MKILFLHGWQSIPGGVKPTYLKQHRHEVITPKLPDDDFPKAVRIGQAEFDKHQLQAVVGSSRGGAVAMSINSGDARLVLLPASALVEVGDDHLLADLEPLEAILEACEGRAE
jgi:hypothetical protein